MYILSLEILTQQGKTFKKNIFDIFCQKMVLFEIIWEHKGT